MTFLLLVRRQFTELQSRLKYRHILTTKHAATLSGTKTLRRLRKKNHCHPGGSACFFLFFSFFPLSIRKRVTRGQTHCSTSSPGGIFSYKYKLFCLLQKYLVYASKKSPRPRPRRSHAARGETVAHDTGADSGAAVGEERRGVGSAPRTLPYLGLVLYERYEGSTVDNAPSRFVPRPKRRRLPYRKRIASLGGM